MGSVYDLYELLEQHDSLGIVCHNNPDPDVLASALGLSHIATNAEISNVAILYSGTITHQQNRALVNLIDIELTELTPGINEQYELVALVDHAIPGVNNDLQPDTKVDIIIDHHPNVDTDATYIDQREELGATATILTEYIDALGIDFTEPLATALLFAIRRETRGLLRGVTEADHDAVKLLHTHADHELLGKLNTPPLSADTIDTVKRAIENRRIQGGCLVTYVGQTPERDALPQAADYLINLENVTVAIVAGSVNGTLHLCARSAGSGLHAGLLLQDAFGDIGSAGGHQDMAGGQISLGIFESVLCEEKELFEMISCSVEQRVFEAL